MKKIKPIKEKIRVIVKSQENCTAPGKPYHYVKGQDCLNDCTAFNKPRYYKSVNL